ncbi:hypothetical protein [Catenovulum sediminis]|uniref:Uncharacterized protein n=1 Tax=Catenovulum sediminis TaxID=1740262 RepID=A0ABV1RCE9_9ALTE
MISNINNSNNSIVNTQYANTNNNTVASASKNSQSVITATEATKLANNIAQFNPAELLASVSTTKINLSQALSLVD